MLLTLKVRIVFSRLKITNTHCDVQKLDISVSCPKKGTNIYCWLYYKIHNFKQNNKYSWLSLLCAWSKLFLFCHLGFVILYMACYTVDSVFQDLNYEEKKSKKLDTPFFIQTQVDTNIYRTNFINTIHTVSANTF